MDEQTKHRLANLSPLRSAARLNAEPKPEYPLNDDPAAEFVEKPRELPLWKKIIFGVLRISTVAAPSAGAGFAVAQVQMPQTQSTPTAQADQNQALDGEGESAQTSARVDEFMPVLDATVPKSAQTDAAATRSTLVKGCEFIKSQSIDMLEDAIKEVAKVTLVGAPMFLLANFLKRRSDETGNRSLGWCAEAAGKIAELFGKHPINNVVTSEELENTFGEKTLAAEALLVMLGYRKKANLWGRAD